MVSLLRHLRDHVAFEGTRRTLYDAAPVSARLALVDQRRPLAHRRVIQRFDQLGERLLDLRSHALDALPVCGVVQPHVGETYGRKSITCLLILVVGFRLEGDVVPLAVILHTARTLPLEVVVHRVKELMRQRTGPARLGQVDDDLSRLVVSRRPAVSARTEPESQLAVQRNGLGRHADDFRQVVEGVERLVQHPLALFHVRPLRYPVAELHATETESALEHLGRHVAALPVVLRLARAVLSAAYIRFLHVVGVLDGFPCGHEGVVLFIYELAGLNDDFVLIRPGEGFELAVERVALLVDEVPLAGRSAYLELHSLLGGISFKPLVHGFCQFLHACRAGTVIVVNLSRCVWILDLVSGLVIGIGFRVVLDLTDAAPVLALHHSEQLDLVDQLSKNAVIRELLQELISAHVLSVSHQCLDGLYLFDPTAQFERLSRL
ncbi:MAG: hypothetical protein BWY57_03443 [Betaproteobacteria bacterium ADurb.Bin341]|nr:MAG: hypothetical protein BWY57_03443 [Betaproteobacteria bacterium ADurb.Bin341]